MELVKFSDLILSEEMHQAIAEMGFENASPIQSEAIPSLLEGRDVIGQAQTGTGKTAAFGIPMIEKIDPSLKGVQGLVLCPTRELAVQVSEELKKLAKFKKGIFVSAIFGGDSIDRQIRDLKKGVQIVVGTPGRVIDHIERGTLKLAGLRMITLDEADEMLDMGFREDIESVLEQMPEERQMVLFSATMSKPIMAIANRYQRNPKLVKVVKNELTNVNIEQLYFDVKPKAKLEVMTRLIDFYQLKLILIFCNTKAKVDDVVENLLLRGYQAEGLHGDMRQQARTNVMNKFRGGSTSILVATDVAARGIDVDNVDAVINFDVPLDEEYYVHRIGRTGRAGKSGKAFTLIVGGERNRLRDVMAFTKVKIEKAVIPSFSDIVGIKKARFIEQVQETIQAGSLELFDDVLQNLTHAGFQSSEIVSALVKLSMNIQQSEFGDENLDGEFDRQNRKFSNERTGYDRGGYGGGSSYGNRDSRGGSSYGNRDSRGGSSYGNRDSRGGNDDRRGSYGSSEPRGNDRPRFDQEGRPFKKAAGDGNMARIMINVGRNERITPSHIVGAIAGEAGVPGSAIGHIELQDRVTFVDVPKDMSARIIKAMDGNTIKGLRVNVKNA